MVGALLAAAEISISFHRSTIPEIHRSAAVPAGFWVWAGRSVHDIPPDLPLGAPVYLHQATLERPLGGLRTLRRQGPGPVKVEGHPLFLVYRIETDRGRPPVVSEEIIERYRADASLWRLRGNYVLGIQIDFDSPTGKLSTYISFLAELKRKIGTDKISITGLADWAADPSPDELVELTDTADEVVFQLYDGNGEIPGLSVYAAKLSRLNRSFKAGVLRRQLAVLPSELVEAPGFGGAVLFGES